jgi:hypothetical protein
MLCLIIFGILCTILMLRKTNRRYEECKCCFTNLSKIKSCDIRAVSSLDIVRKLNETRKKIRSRSRGQKSNDETLIELNDLVCKRCISYANYDTSKLVKTKRMRVLSPERELRAESIQVVERNEMDADSIELNIPRTASTHSRCVICSNSGKMVCVPKEAYFDTFINSNIIIPKGMSLSFSFSVFLSLSLSLSLSL